MKFHHTNGFPKPPFPPQVQSSLSRCKETRQVLPHLMMLGPMHHQNLDKRYVAWAFIVQKENWDQFGALQKGRWENTSQNGRIWRLKESRIWRWCKDTSCVPHDWQKCRFTLASMLPARCVNDEDILATSIHLYKNVRIYRCLKNQGPNIH